jgi:pilus assembly protein CpaE
MNSFVYRDGGDRPGHLAGAVQPRVMAFLDDAATARRLAALYRDRGHEPPEILQGGLGAALESSGLPADLDLLIVDVDSTLLPIADIGALRTVLPDGVKIAALGSNEDDLYGRELIYAGASSYLVKPVSSERMERLVFGARAPQPAPAQEGLPAATQKMTERHVVVLGVRGGLGATSLAVNLAWTLGERSRQPALLLDLDLQFGTALLSLNLQPSNALVDMLRDPRRIDNVLLRHSVQEVGRHLGVLGAEEPLDARLALDPSAMQALMGEIGSTFRYVVVDLPAHRLDLLGPGLAAATDIVLVSELSLAGVRDTLRMLAEARQHAPDGVRWHLVIGGTVDARYASMTQGQFEESVGHEVETMLPHEPVPMNEAAAAGRAVTGYKPGSKIAKAYARFAGRFLPAEQKSGRGLLGLRIPSAFRAAS